MAAGQRRGVGQLEVGELEPRRDEAADEGVAGSGKRRGAEPSSGRDHVLETGAGRSGRAEPGPADPAAGVHLNDLDRSSGVVDPGFLRSNAVKAGTGALLEQVQDRGEGGAPPPGAGKRDGEGGAVDFAVPPSLRMRAETEAVDEAADSHVAATRTTRAARVATGGRGEYKGWP